MALIHCNFFSEVLGVSSSICVILPQITKSQIGMGGSSKKEKYPTLYLLHGLSDDETIWQRRTSIERYVAEMGLAVVMPAVGRSFYTNMANGYDYWTYVTQELPEIARSFFPLSEKREDNFVAGLSMGGYGALKMALGCPDKFAAGASLSGAVDMASVTPNDGFPLSEILNIYGDIKTIKNSENDLFYLAKKVSESDGPKPKLFQCCGTEDMLHDSNIKFRDYAKTLSLNYTFEEGPGTHEWGYWDTNIQRVLNWLPIKN
jgi:putative tributyrin esterase